MNSAPSPIVETLLRKSSRTHKKPAYLESYVCNAIHFTDVSSSCFLSPVTVESFYFSDLSSTNQAMLNSISGIQESINYMQAAHHPGWQEAMDKELSALELNKTWEIVVLPDGKRELPSK
ncbi:hypothetical protein KY290_033416 [Solanum tuberosum]|uniref:Uncharacterized protein n=1 Tax=Solanum tuberosum TaxID=4113 RepID=A0ABQ7U216_SOLTU|nr:hypothetical protein KY289_032777 [Solanum tuberosum]KAH0740373.1 hypothetical protein KY290_033416 [Solanum tuberosum]